MQLSRADCLNSICGEEKIEAVDVEDFLWSKPVVCYQWTNV